MKYEGFICDYCGSVRDAVQVHGDNHFCDDHCFRNWLRDPMAKGTAAKKQEGIRFRQTHEGVTHL